MWGAIAATAGNIIGSLIGSRNNTTAQYGAPEKDNTSTYLTVAAMIILLVIIVLILRKK